MQLQILYLLDTQIFGHIAPLYCQKGDYKYWGGVMPHAAMCTLYQYQVYQDHYQEKAG